MQASRESSAEPEAMRSIFFVEVLGEPLGEPLEELVAVPAAEAGPIPPDWLEEPCIPSLAQPPTNRLRKAMIPNTFVDRLLMANSSPGERNDHDRGNPTPDAR